MQLVTLRKVTVTVTTTQNEPVSSLASDSEQDELMRTAYAVVGLDFADQEDFVGAEHDKLLRLAFTPGLLLDFLFPYQSVWITLTGHLAGCC